MSYDYSKETEVLAPVTHMLSQLVNADLPEGPLSALNEFIDNAFGPDAGNAQAVRISYKPDMLVIDDNGQGVLNLNSLFRIGDSVSRLSRTDIGNFGYGSKVGVLYMGKHMMVQTVREGEYHAFEVDWEQVAECEQWPAPYQGKPLKFPKVKPITRGTRIIIRKRHRTFQLLPLAERMAHVYGPALRDGREITLAHYDLAGKLQKEVKVSELAGKTPLESVTTCSLVVNGKRVEVRAGAMLERKGRLNGVHLAFGHRVIRTERVLSQPLPARLYVEAKLDTAWKPCLTALKNDILTDKAELLAAIEECLADLIAMLHQEVQERRLDLITAVERGLCRGVPEAG